MIGTRIEWCHHTLNFWWGCTKVSPACMHCYAETITKLFGRGRAVWGLAGQRWVRDNAIKEAEKIEKLSLREGGGQRVFVNSMSDTFEEHPQLHGARWEALRTIESLPGANWLLLTKRPQNVLKMVPAAWLKSWPSHVWIGTTVENQECADERIPVLLEIPAKVRFLSCEPLLGPVLLRGWETYDHACAGRVGEPSPRIDWVIAGGESGPGFRAPSPEWLRSLRAQCVAADVPFFFKQWGGRTPKAGGAELDGVEWKQVPRLKPTSL